MLRRCEEVGRGRAAHVIRLHEWVAANSNLFRGPVYGPVAVELSVMGNNPRWVDYVEHACRGQLYNFVVSCREDEQTLNEQVKQFNAYNITVACVVSDYNAPIRHTDIAKDQLSHWGIAHTLDEVIDAPKLVKHMLCDLARINRLYIGSDATMTHLNECLPMLRTLYVGDTKRTHIASQYNREAVNTVTEGIGNAHLLVGASASTVEQERQECGVQVQRLQQELQALRQQQEQHRASRDAAQAEIARIDRGLNELAARRKAIKGKKAQVDLQLRTTRRQLEGLERQPEPLDQEPALKQRINNLINQMADKSNALVSDMKLFYDTCKKLLAADLALKEREAQVEAVKRWHSERQQALQEARRTHQRLQQEVTNADNKYQELKAIAEQVPPTEEDAAKMLELPAVEEELDTLAMGKQAEADAIVCNDEGVARQYEARKRQIEDLRAQVAGLDTELAAQQADLDAKRDQWLPMLKLLVGTINDKFGENFKEIGCAGEVALREHEDYDKYAIEIRVKFRENEELQLLTAQRQSGGERSVSTILYLIALQAVTETPFRVVDEINQGMDPVNERKVFGQLVESSCKPETPQCFLLTPKLLPGLTFKPEVTVLTIMNGPHIDAGLIAAYDKRTGMYGERWNTLAQQRPAVAVN